MSLSLSFLSFFSIFLFFQNLGEIFPQPLLLEVFKYFLLKHFILYVLLYFINKYFLLLTFLQFLASTLGLGSAYFWGSGSRKPTDPSDPKHCIHMSDCYLMNCSFKIKNMVGEGVQLTGLITKQNIKQLFNPFPPTEKSGSIT